MPRVGELGRAIPAKFPPAVKSTRPPSGGRLMAILLNKAYFYS
jgi:hypothetical protein